MDRGGVESVGVWVGVRFVRWGYFMPGLKAGPGLLDSQKFVRPIADN